jgi:hypothetical protein
MGVCRARAGLLGLLAVSKACAVQPLTVVDNSDFFPTGLTFPLDGPYSTFSDGNGPSSLSSKENAS